MDNRIKPDIWIALEKRQLPEDRLIYHLSGMLSEDIEKFSRIWNELPLHLKRQLVSKMRDIGEADFAVDFASVFTLGLQSDDPEVCVASLEGLSESEDIRLLPQLFHLLRSNSSDSVRASTAQLLGSFVLLGELEKIKSHLFDKTLTVLLETYNSSNMSIDVKRRILEALSFTGTRNISGLIEQAYWSAHPKMVVSAIFSMGRSADKQWSEIVQNELSNPDPEIRYEAARACGELQIPEAVSDLIELTNDADFQVQEMALWSLGQIGGQRARRRLEIFTQSDNEALRDAAENALEELDFFQNGLSSFLGPPSEFSGEGEDSWFDATGVMSDVDADDELVIDLLDDKDLFDFEFTEMDDDEDDEAGENA